MDLKSLIRDIPDFPAKDVVFRDITTLLKDPKGLVSSIDMIAEQLEGIEFDMILGPESRGFIFGMPLAYKLGKGFIPARKAGKLPAETAKTAYVLEYGEAVIEVHKDAVVPGSRIVIVDDLLATGGTAKAVAELITDLGAEVAGMVFLIELESLGGRGILKPYDNVKTVLKY